MTESPLDDALRKDIDYLRERAKDDGPKVPGSQERSVYASPKRLGEIADHMEEKMARYSTATIDIEFGLVRLNKLNAIVPLTEELLDPFGSKPKKKQLKRPTRRIKLCD